MLILIIDQKRTFSLLGHAQGSADFQKWSLSFDRCLGILCLSSLMAAAVALLTAHGGLELRLMVSQWCTI